MVETSDAYLVAAVGVAFAVLVTRSRDEEFSHRIDTTAVTALPIIRDMLAIRGGSVDKTPRAFAEVRRVIGTNLVNPQRESSLPKLTRDRVCQFGWRMAQAESRVPRPDPMRFVDRVSTRARTDQAHR